MGTGSAHEDAPPKLASGELPGELAADLDWPQFDAGRTAAGWIWLAYLVAQALLGLWWLR